jgi:hypothetical protein
MPGHGADGDAPSGDEAERAGGRCEAGADDRADITPEPREEHANGGLRLPSRR